MYVTVFLAKKSEGGGYDWLRGRVGGGGADRVMGAGD